MTKPNWKPIKVKLGQIQAWGDNPRMSTKAQAQRIIASERKFGQPVPFLLMPEVDGRFPLLDGHQRLAAWQTVYGADYEMDAMVCDRALSDDERREMVVTLHTGATGSWNWEALAGWSAGDLQSWGMDKDALKGWNNDANNLKELLTAEVEPVDAEPQTDRAGELAEKWQTASGQLWKLGDHRLLIGDCTVRENVERLMGGERAGIMVTDPPYGVEYESEKGKVTNDDRFDWTQAYELFSGDVVYVWHGERTSLDVGLNIRNCGFEIRSRIIWVKPSLTMGRGHYHFQHEGAWYGVRKGKKSEWSGDHSQSTVWNIDREDEAHPTVKPVECMQRPMKNHSFQVVYDPFCGSGTTIIAAHNLNRRCFAMEISEKYSAVILQRFLDATGIQPELVE